jgi:excisionase family DNA binding protein
MPKVCVSPVSGPAQSPYLTVAEVAELPRLNPMTIRKWIWRGKLPHMKLGRAIRIDRADLLSWLDQQKVGGA